MASLVFVDCEATGPCPSVGRLTEFGAVSYDLWKQNKDPQFCAFYGDLIDFPGPPLRDTMVFSDFKTWLIKTSPVLLVSDNPAFDWQWINDGFHRTLGANPFGYSARRIGDFYAGLVGDFWKSNSWKRLRITKHNHNPVHDALGNVEAFHRIINGERVKGYNL